MEITDSEECRAGIAVVTLHDIIPLRYRTYEDDKEFEEYKKKLAWTVNRADYIITVSEASKKDIVDYFGIDEKIVSVVHNPINEYFCRLDETAVTGFWKSSAEICNKRIILTMVNECLHKNLNKTLEAFARLECHDAVLVVLGNLREQEEGYEKR